ncbi:hypothetical protein HD593_005938 [Nonomuraea rubra]|uniref:Uncharacterized protein n=1 Tax=Nonomuraea rubra TaxID=46180 RepID=A0A7X0U127_9ACTN|nr:hypothetical protein [Nonomuraea rubra]
MARARRWTFEGGWWHGRSVLTPPLGDVVRRRA